jgi:hypothetical protein
MLSGSTMGSFAGIKDTNLLITDGLVNSLLILGVYSATTWTPKTTVGYTVTQAFIRGV